MPSRGFVLDVFVQQNEPKTSISVGLHIKLMISFFLRETTLHPLARSRSVRAVIGKVKKRRMVFLTALLAVRSRGPDPYWKRQFAKRLTWVCTCICLKGVINRARPV